MSNTILLKRSGNAAVAPLAANLTLGELSLNYADGILYFLNSSNAVTVLANANTASGTQLVNGTSNVVTRTSGNVTVSSAGTANVLTITSTGIYTTGLSSVTGNVTGGNILTAGVVSATGNITGTYFIGNGSLLTGITSGGGGGVLTAAVDTFTGNGSTTTFTLSTTPSSITLVSVNINGVSQLQSAYSLSTNQIIFTSAPTVGATVQVTTLYGTSLTTLSGNISTTGNITGNYILGNGSQLTGLPATCSNANVATFLAAFGSNTISTTGTINSGNITGGNVLTAGVVSATGNVYGNSFAVPNNQYYGFATQANTGMYFDGDYLKFNLNNNLNFLINSVGPYSYRTHQFVQGTAANPSLLYGGFTGVGLYFPDAGTVGVAASSNQVAAFSSAGLSVTGNISTTGNITGGNIRTVGQVSATGNVTGNYFIGNGSQLTGVATSFAPTMFNDVSGQTNGNTAVFALKTDQTAVTGITNSKQLQVTVNGAVVQPYINSWTWPFFTTYYRSYPGFRVTNLGYGLTANSVVIYNAPAVSSQVTVTQVNTSTDTQLRRYPYSATAIAIGD